MEWSANDEEEHPINQKYEITDLAHQRYPFLHRIRALREIGHAPDPQVRRGDLGGFVEGEHNLSSAAEDGSWIFDDAIVCGNAYVGDGAQVSRQAIVSGDACVTARSQVTDHAAVSDSAYLQNACVSDSARVYGSAQVVGHPAAAASPRILGKSVVYGKIQGAVEVSGETVVFEDETIRNTSPDRWLIQDGKRSVIAAEERETLEPLRGEGYGKAERTQKAVRRERGGKIGSSHDIEEHRGEVGRRSWTAHKK